MLCLRLGVRGGDLLHELVQAWWFQFLPALRLAFVQTLPVLLLSRVFTLGLVGTSLVGLICFVRMIVNVLQKIISTNFNHDEFGSTRSTAYKDLD